MMERVRILLVAAPAAPVRGLAARLQDPDLDILAAGSAGDALDRLGPSMADVIIIDGSLPGRERLPALRASAVIGTRCRRSDHLYQPRSI